MTKAPITQDTNEVVAAASQPQSLPLTELLDDAFIQEYTDFESVGALAAAFGLPAIDSLEQLDSQEFNAFLSAHSRFEDGRQMLEAAATKHGARS